jgi:hypothetical protein
MSNENEIGFQPKEVTISAKIPFELHLAAKQIYSMQGTRIGERVQQLIRADLKKTMGRDWFKELPEREIAIYKMFIDLSERKNLLKSSSVGVSDSK